MSYPPWSKLNEHSAEEHACHHHAFKTLLLERICTLTSTSTLIQGKGKDVDIQLLNARNDEAYLLETRNSRRYSAGWILVDRARLAACVYAFRTKPVAESAPLLFQCVKRDLVDEDTRAKVRIVPHDVALAVSAVFFGQIIERRHKLVPKQVIGEIKTAFGDSSVAGCTVFCFAGRTFYSLFSCGRYLGTACVDLNRMTEDLHFESGCDFLSELVVEEDSYLETFRINVDHVFPETT